jgi:hypothetical protein
MSARSTVGRGAGLVGCSQGREGGVVSDDSHGGIASGVGHHSSLGSNQPDPEVLLCTRCTRVGCKEHEGAGAQCVGWAILWHTVSTWAAHNVCVV